MYFKMKCLLYNMPFMDYIIFELCFLAIASQVTLQRVTTFNHVTKGAALDQLS